MQLSFYKKILFTFLVVSFSLFLLEGSIRLLDLFYHIDNYLKAITMAVPNENRIYELKPNYYQRAYTDEYSTQVYINSFGLREREIPFKKPADTFRIIALGDSHTFGMGVEAEERWSDVLEKMLNSQQGKVRYEVINLGVWGYTFDQQLLRLKEKGLPFQPDMVIQGIHWTHLQTLDTHKWIKDEQGLITAIHDPYVYVDNRGVLRRTEDIGWLASLRKKSRLIDILAHKIKTFLASEKVPNQDLVYLSPDNYSKVESQWEKMFDSIRETRDLLKQKNIRYLVFLIPRDVQVSRNEWDQPFYKGMTDDLYNEQFPQKVMKNFLDKEKISYIDFLPIFQAKYEPDLFFPVDIHLAKKGHYLTAQILFSFLQRTLYGITE